MKRVARFFLWTTAALVVIVLAILALAWHPAIDPVASHGDVAARNLVEVGARLSAAGNCASCHTRPGGTPFAGGVPLETPFGTIHGANLTPDIAHGIGAWSLPAFARAMRDGVSRDGHLLYPAFPYDHFRGTDDNDLRALYAFLMSRDPAAETPPPNHLLPPLQWRPVLAAWNLLFLRDAVKAPPPPDDPVVARGRYLVDTLGHCGGCHTPRNVLGAEKTSSPLDGAVLDGWYAPPLNARTPSPVRWTEPAMLQYLRTGITADHAIAAGPMQVVVNNLALADEADVSALARAIVAVMYTDADGGEPSREAAREAASRQRAAQPLAGRVDASADRVDPADPRLALGASVYATSCAQCHDRGRQVSSASGLQMPLAVALYEDEPLSLLRVIREGIVPPDGQLQRWMPAYGETLTDAQLVALLAYLRRVAADRAAWPHLERTVADTQRSSRARAMDRP